NAIGHPVDHGDQGIQNLEQYAEHDRCGKGHAFRVQNSQGLWRDFRENQNHQCERECCNGDSGFTVKPQRDEGRNGRGEDVDEVIAQQDDADKPIGSIEQATGAHSTLVLVLGEVAQAIAVERHHAGLGTGKERGQYDQKDQDGEEHTNGNVAQSDLAVTRPEPSIRSGDGGCQAVEAAIAW
ncbi:MAG: hypothetical protein ACI9DC_005442, partial [Gammaproteobacteria bacterium]